MRIAAFLMSAGLAAIMAARPGGGAAADTLVATRTLRAGTVLVASDVALVKDEATLLLLPEAAVGLETRVAIYQGRTLRAESLGPPTLVERNQTVLLHYARGQVRIETGGRALERGGAGDAVRVINLASRVTVTGTILADGTIAVPVPPLTE